MEREREIRSKAERVKPKNTEQHRKFGDYLFSRIHQGDEERAIGDCRLSFIHRQRSYVYPISTSSTASSGGSSLLILFFFKTSCSFSFIFFCVIISTEEKSCSMFCYKEEDFLPNVV
ncbi:hypothetical protein K2173_009716 [Erythroxylum novogranatense]|uniref:Uncharacterized protein n=1 Tax=Erythroxylum novogranatense TaxID=1862640 RepID=A0AAV8U8L5_9ROSI|nr:hypothetical protein K2173_009716 [Erythroxylum novogranatense]